VLENGKIRALVQVGEERIGTVRIEAGGQGQAVSLERPLAVLLKDGRMFGAGNLKATSDPAVRELTPHADAPRTAERVHGVELDVPLETEDHALRIGWSLILLDGSNYVRQAVTLTAGQQDVAIERVELIDVPLTDAHVAGRVDGSPIVAGNFFLGFEHPLSKSRVTAGRAMAWMERDLPLRSGQSVTYSAVIGVARPGQMRRDFLAYVERERAHPYRTFLHYNSWYDLGYFDPYDANGAVDRLNFFGRELVEKRGVHMDSCCLTMGGTITRRCGSSTAGFPRALRR
jgi:hypothetical protein